MHPSAHHRPSAPRFVSRFLWALCLSLLLGSAGLSEPGFAAAPADGRPGGRLVIGSPQEPGSLLAHFDLLTLTHEVQHLIYDCLFTLDSSGEYVPRLAAEVPTLENGGISPDGRVYTIRLREG